MSVERVQSDSMISQSVAAQPKTQKTHQCEYYTEMKKANKIIQKKNREIQTLNRIIKNLKIDINELNSNKKQSKEEVHELRQQLDKARKKLSELQLKQIQNQRQICEQRLQSAQKLIINQRQSKIKRDSSQDYFSECQFSRNTNDEKYIIMESSKKRDSMQCTFQSNRDLHAYDKKSMNMGQLFMGKKMKLQVEDARLYKNSSWGKFQLLHQGNVQHPSYGYDSSSSFMRKTPSFGGYEGRMNVQQAINYLKLENQGLKMSIF